MNSFELNKIFGAILGTLVFVMGVGFIAEAIYAPIENRGAGYELPEPVAEAGGEAVVEDVIPVAVLMQTASAEAGERLINRCQSCHDYSPANTNRTGPGIYDIVGQEIAHHEGFTYSDALLALGAAGEIWDYDNLDHFLESPRHFAPGTRMSFAGLANPEDRANLIAFLRSLSDNPYPLPEVEATEEPVVEAEEPGVDGAPVVEMEAPETEPADQPVAPAQPETSAPVAPAPATPTPASAEPEAAPVN